MKYFFRERFNHLFSSLFQALFSSENLNNFADVVHNCWGFIGNAAKACKVFYKIHTRFAKNIHDFGRNLVILPRFLELKISNYR